MAVNAGMAEVIASTAEGLSISTGKAMPSFNAEPAMSAQETENLTIEASIDLTDIDVDQLESQPEMAFGNLVKKS